MTKYTEEQIREKILVSNIVIIIAGIPEFIYLTMLEIGRVMLFMNMCAFFMFCELLVFMDVLIGKIEVD